MGDEDRGAGLVYRCRVERDKAHPVGDRPIRHDREDELATCRAHTHLVTGSYAEPVDLGGRETKHLGTGERSERRSRLDERAVIVKRTPHDKTPRSIGRGSARS